ncbi:hypothetical protein G9A89_002921 [Geosiphon pyriformis]|nr:hypothetical protein G9A89_002921 [Geosiphon pyriformis]
MNTERRGGEYIESNEHTCYSSKDSSHQANGNSERRWRHLVARYAGHYAREEEKEKEKVGGERKEGLLEPEKDAFLKKLKRLLFETLPVFFDAYAWPYDNPLKNRDMLEEKFMNTYIYPVLKKTLHRFSNICYIRPNEATVQQYAQPDGSLMVNPQWIPSEQYETHKREQDYLGGLWQKCRIIKL